MVPQLAEILVAQPEQRCAIELRVSAYVVVRVRMQRLAIAVAPLFTRVVLRVLDDGARAPVVLLPRYKTAAFENQDPLACGCELIGERAAARACADDDYVIVHDQSPF